ncbi:3-phosphoshikimate 1-carboxyvinyltransferase [Sinomicrobium sp.]
MNLRIFNPQKLIKGNIKITGSKSESNRLLLLQALYPDIAIENLSNSDDSVVMQKALTTDEEVVDIHHAGTAMRFLTAFFATRPGREVTLTGSKRMTERPIKILVDALRQLGADITYTVNEGYPPLHIKGKQPETNKVSLQAGVSSQYISALLLVGPTLPGGLELTLEGKITSVPYIKMTLALLEEVGVTTAFEGQKITVSHTPEINPATLTVESDWSSASYFYSIAALAEEGAEINLSAYKESSLQGDSVLAEIYEQFGVNTVFKENSISLIKESEASSAPLVLDLSNAPDIAQTIAVTCFGLGRGCQLKGLHTLKIKETDRLEALRNELTKLGATIRVTDAELFLEPAKTIKENISISTYNDHRMAMAFAPLGLKVPLIVEDAGVVSKSYPDFWKDMENLGYKTEGRG